MNKKKLSKKIRKDIMSCLLGRKGFSYWFYICDYDNRQEIKKELDLVILNKLKGDKDGN